MRNERRGEWDEKADQSRLKDEGNVWKGGREKKVGEPFEILSKESDNPQH